MKDLSDIELLETYATTRSEGAFRELVGRHIDLVYSAALRQLRNPHLAEEATQSAFIALAGKAGRLNGRTVILGWLHRAVLFAALNLQRSEARRKRWEEEAAAMNPAEDTEPVFSDCALLQIDGAVAELNEKDRAAILLRYFQKRSFRDLAQLLGLSEEAAKKRVGRALDKLRGLLERRGVTISSVAIAAGLSQLPVTAAPTALSSAVVAAAAGATASGISVGAIVLELIARTKAKLALLTSVMLLSGTVGLVWLYRSTNAGEAQSSPPNLSIPRIALASVMVDDQDKALRFYTEVLGFVKKFDIPTGEPGGARWLTVVSPESSDGTELLLEPIGFAPAKTYQQALFEAGMPLISFAVADVQQQFERLKKLGVRFSAEPATIESNLAVILDDTCGNRIRIVQTPPAANSEPNSALRIRLNSILVDDQEKALKFYTGCLGLVKKTDFTVGSKRRLTVASPEESSPAELLLESTTFAPARRFQEAVRQAGLPATQLAVADIQQAYERLTVFGVEFHGKPMKTGFVTTAIFDDTCGNLIQLLQK